MKTFGDFDFVKKNRIPKAQASFAWPSCEGFTAKAAAARGRSWMALFSLTLWMSVIHEMKTLGKRLVGIKF